MLSNGNGRYFLPAFFSSKPGLFKLYQVVAIIFHRNHPQTAIGDRNDHAIQSYIFARSEIFIVFLRWLAIILISEKAKLAKASDAKPWV
jgi:hypothetical protein